MFCVLLDQGHDYKATNYKDSTEEHQPYKLPLTFDLPVAGTHHRVNHHEEDGAEGYKPARTSTLHIFQNILNNHGDHQGQCTRENSVHIELHLFSQTLSTALRSHCAASRMQANDAVHDQNSVCKHTYEKI